MRIAPRTVAAIVAVLVIALGALILVKLNAESSSPPEDINPIVMTPSQSPPTLRLIPGFNVDDGDEHGDDDVGDDEDDGDFNRITPEPRDLNDDDDD